MSTYNTVIFKVNTESKSYNNYNYDIQYNSNKNTKRSLQILIVDDDVNIAKLLKECIELRGHKVTIVDEGTRSITLCADNKYDVVLLDYHLKDIDGVEVANILTDFIHENTLLFAFTGDNSQQAIQKFQTNKMHGMIIKPVDVQSLETLLSNIENKYKLDNDLVSRFSSNNILLFKK